MAEYELADDKLLYRNFVFEKSKTVSPILEEDGGEKNG